MYNILSCVFMGFTYIRPPVNDSQMNIWAEVSSMNRIVFDMTALISILWHLICDCNLLTITGYCIWIFICNFILTATFILCMNINTQIHFHNCFGNYVEVLFHFRMSSNQMNNIKCKWQGMTAQFTFLYSTFVCHLSLHWIPKWLTIHRI